MIPPIIEDTSIETSSSEDNIGCSSHVDEVVSVCKSCAKETSITFETEGCIGIKGGESTGATANSVDHIAGVDKGGVALTPDDPDTDHNV